MISCQFSLYPLGVMDLSPAIEAAVAELRRLGLETDVGPMSTYVAGETNAVFEGLRERSRSRPRKGTGHDSDGSNAVQCRTRNGAVLSTMALTGRLLEVNLRQVDAAS
jgi:hypothetical protein